MSLVALAIGVFAQPASAVDPKNPEGSFNFVVSPITANLETKPGATVTANLQIKNQGISTERIKTTVLKFKANGQDGTPNILDVKPGDETVSWVSLTPSIFEAEPNVWKTVKLSITPPKSAAFGYYYAIVFSREGAEKQVQNSKANLLGAAASLILLDVKAPGAIRQVKITEFSTPKKVQEFLPVDFTIRLKNTGNTHVSPRGNIFITKGGKSVGLLEVNLAKGNILPDSSRKFEASWTDSTPVYKLKVVDKKVALNKQGKQIYTLDWSNFNMSKLRFGKYDAKLVMVYDDGQGDISTDAKVSFWVIPWRIIGVGLVAIVIGVAGLWALLIRPIRQRIKKNRRGNAPLR